MTSQCGAYALHAGLARLHALIRMHTPTRLRTHMHAHAHRPISNTYCFCTVTMIAKALQCYVMRTLPVLFKLTRNNVKKRHLSFRIIYNLIVLYFIEYFTHTEKSKKKTLYLRIFFMFYCSYCILLRMWIKLT